MQRYEPAPEPCSARGAKEQEHRLKVLFQVLDVNGDGGICINDLTIGLKKLGVHRTEHELLVSRDAPTGASPGPRTCQAPQENLAAMFVVTLDQPSWL